MSDGFAGGQTRRVSAVCCGLVIASSALGFAAERDPQAFVLHTADGADVTGPLAALGDDWSVRLRSSPETRAEGKDVLTLRRAGKPLPPLPVRQHVCLANGDVVRFSRLKVFGEQVQLQAECGDGPEWHVPLSAVSVLWLASPDAAEQPDRLRRRLATEKRARDAVLLRNGDVLEGVLAGMDDKVVRVEADKKEVEIGRDKVAAVALSTELARLPAPNGLSGRLVLADGSRLTLNEARCTDGRTLTGKAVFGADVRVPVAEVVALYVHGGRAVYLSDLKPKAVEHASFGGDLWPWVADSSVAGRDLRLGGSTFDKGLGTHSRTRLTYALDGNYKRFEALVGLDGETGREGSARIGVLVDGKPQDLGGEAEWTAKNGPRPVRVNVAGAKELTLLVDFGRRGHVQDHVDWADARLVK